MPHIANVIQLFELVLPSYRSLPRSIVDSVQGLPVSWDRVVVKRPARTANGNYDLDSLRKCRQRGQCAIAIEGRLQLSAVVLYFKPASCG